MSHDYAVTDGHALLSLHRYLEHVRHMVIFDDLVEYGHHRVLKNSLIAPSLPRR